MACSSMANHRSCEIGEDADRLLLTVDNERKWALLLESALSAVDINLASTYRCRRGDVNHFNEEVVDKNLKTLRKMAVVTGWR